MYADKVGLYIEMGDNKLCLKLVCSPTVWTLRKSPIDWEGSSTTVKTATVKQNSMTLMEYLILSSWPPETSRKEKNSFMTTATAVKLR